MLLRVLQKEVSMSQESVSLGHLFYGQSRNVRDSASSSPQHVRDLETTVKRLKRVIDEAVENASEHKVSNKSLDR